METIFLGIITGRLLAIFFLPGQLPPVLIYVQSFKEVDPFTESFWIKIKAHIDQMYLTPNMFGKSVV